MTICDDYMCGSVFQDKYLVKELIEVLFCTSISNVKNVDIQKFIPNGHRKYIRLDILVECEEGIFNIEMQNRRDNDLIKRMDKYGSILTSWVYRKMYNKEPELNDNVIVDKNIKVCFICGFDILKKKLCVYSPNRFYEHDKSIRADDLLEYRICNYKAKDGYLSVEMKELFEFFNGKDVSNPFIEKIKSKIEEVKSRRGDYMVWDKILAEAKADGRNEERQLIKVEMREKDELIKKNNDILNQKDNMLEEKDNMLEEKDNMLEEKDNKILEYEMVIASLYNSGVINTTNANVAVELVKSKVVSVCKK